ncbi:MAG: hypothetical protein QOG20_2340 [Pseudonocardiales bacterium]|jgi:hypothetical protein|uniref:hypothetical protein n=1 Tax=Pseudonocardia sp. TaxID=60912 RepID=UPI00261D76CE|nr:hypothetical protein [Pseudonocardia sp.]MCW2718727.1 hypothetical protein [Pseudonocardia sp.]MDT7616761.1 hypothetical protein [Pseudonocardiales bacterium]MDT7706733.1 hypothetical protein [Pseudonocardiales bacterium]
MTGPAADAALRHATGVLNSLTPEQLADLAAGRARLVFRPEPPATRRTRRPVTPEPERSSDVATAVETINRLADPAEVDDYLRRHDGRFTLPVLREIARGLGPTVRANGRNKTELRRDIVAGTAGYRTRSAAMSGGAWS